MSSRFHLILLGRGATGAGVAAAHRAGGSLSPVLAHSIIIAPGDFTVLLTGKSRPVLCSIAIYNRKLLLPVPMLSYAPASL